MQWMLKPYRRYATFSGRAPRIEYWSFVLLQLLVFCFALLCVFGPAMLGMHWFWASRQGLLMGLFALVGIFNLLSIIPGLAVTVRRLHDSNLSGWNLLWAFVPLVGALLLIYYYARPGTAGENAFGPREEAS